MTVIGTPAAAIRRLVTTRQAAEHYGFTPDRAGYICCPFHREKTASLKLFPDGGWKCFGCGAGGSVIDFVMQLFDLSFPQTILRINADFSLGLTWDRPDPAAQAAARAVRRRETLRKAKLDQMAEQYRELAAEHRYWWSVLKYFPPASEGVEDGCIHPFYAEAVKTQLYLEYLLDELERKIADVKEGRGRKDIAVGGGSTGDFG